MSVSSMILSSWRRLGLAGKLALVVVIAVTVGLVAPVGVDSRAAEVADPTQGDNEQLRATFYYPWFPEAWSQQGSDDFTQYEPSRGLYDGGSADIAKEHIEDMVHGGMDAAIASWWGIGSREDGRIPMLLEQSASYPLKWAIYHERESTGDPSIASLETDLNYIEEQYSGHESYWHIDGKPVIFVFADPDDGCSMGRRWAEANNDRFFVVLKVFGGYRNCSNQPSAWHQYGPATGYEVGANDAVSVSPGFWLATEDSPRLARDLGRFRRDLQTAADSSRRFLLVTSYNEWGEGTAVESAEEWSSPSGRGEFIDVMNEVLTTPPPPPPPPPTEPLPPSDPDPGSLQGVIAATGDIACDPNSSNYADGNGRNERCQSRSVALAIQDAEPDRVLALGDLQYEKGELENFNISYRDTFGQYLDPITSPVPGNHEYLTSSARGYYDYFGAAAGDPDKGYYSYDIGKWHVVALNSSCSGGKCDEGSQQDVWLQADLEANAGMCTLAYMHHPRFSSGVHGDDDRVDNLWRRLSTAGVEAVLTGHEHNYERFAPMDADGRTSSGGLRQFIVGTGGKGLRDVGSPRAGSEVTDSSSYGFLKMSLLEGGYEWEFVSAGSGTFTDRGADQCNGPGDSEPVPDPVPPTTPETAWVSALDTYVNESSRDSSFGNRSKLRVDGSPEVVSFLRFSVVGSPGGRQDTVLRVYANSSLRTGVQVRAVDAPVDSWDGTVTWATAPDVGAVLGSSGPVSAGEYLEINLGGLVTGDGTYEVAITSTGSTALSLSGNEDSNAPQLALLGQ